MRIEEDFFSVAITMPFEAVILLESVRFGYTSTTYL